MADTDDSGGVQEIEQAEELVFRVAAIDIAKASGMACVRVPHEGKPGRRAADLQHRRDRRRDSIRPTT
ncbi:hypothetical protein ACFW9I_36045 [[Kitasatospora] papulosa]|uniref:hypothetical protein n=1 Tax=[Kitasatospora] papulosa TaxID=1464011 RepID=UPI0036B02629